MSVSTTDCRHNSRPVTRGASTKGDSDELSVMHQRLAVHFGDLRGRRAALGHGSPVFAFVHRLYDAELAEVESAVRFAVCHECLPGGAWLPLVVYAAGYGSRCRGDEYWQT